MRKTLLTFVVCIVVCVAVAAGIALYRHVATFREYGDIQMYVSIGMAVIGGLLVGSGRGHGDPYAAMVAESMSHDPDEYRRAMAEDHARGLAFGWIVLLAGIASGAVCYFFIA